MNKEKKIERLKGKNEFHRQQRWSRGIVQESKKTYKRKSKHKPNYKEY